MNTKNCIRSVTESKCQNYDQHYLHSTNKKSTSKNSISNGSNYSQNSELSKFTL